MRSNEEQERGLIGLSLSLLLLFAFAERGDDEEDEAEEEKWMDIRLTGELDPLSQRAIFLEVILPWM